MKTIMTPETELHAFYVNTHINILIKVVITMNWIVRIMKGSEAIPQASVISWEQVAMTSYLY